MDRARYPDDWESISLRIRERENWRCKWCNAENGQPHPTTGSKVVLTVAHVYDPEPMNCNPRNLAALCQRCHLNHDRPHHIRKAKARRRAARATGDLFLTSPSVAR